MTPLFLYGSLRHDALLQIVLGGATPPKITPAALADHAVHWVAGASYPCLTPQEGATAQGEVLAEASPEMQARMDYYEACFGYTTRQATLTDGRDVRIYVSSEVPKRGAPWELAVWQDTWGALSVEAAREVMLGFGVEAAEDVGARFPVIRARAASRLRANEQTPVPFTEAPQRPVKKDVVIQSLQRAYNKFFALMDVVITHRRFDGRMSAPLERAVFVMVDSVTVLPYDPLRDEVLVIEQFRAGPLLRGESEPWSMEPIAGRIDAGETPHQTAHRESLEEAGLTLKALEEISHYYPSPGATSEFLYSYVGIADLSAAHATVAGLDEEGEDILSHVLSFDTFMKGIAQGHNSNGPLVLSAYWLAQNRTRLRAEAHSGAPREGAGA